MNVLDRARPVLASRAARRLTRIEQMIGNDRSPGALAALGSADDREHPEGIDLDDCARELSDRLGLTQRQLEALIALACAELDPHLRALCDRLADGLNGWLLAELVYGQERAQLVSALSPGSPLLQLGLIELVGSAGILQRSITIAPRVITWLLGDRALDAAVPARRVENTSSEFRPDIARALRPNQALVITGPAGSGKTDLVATAAAINSWQTIAADAVGLKAAAARALVREARLLGAVLVIENAEALWDGDPDRLRALQHSVMPIVFTSTIGTFRAINFSQPTRRVEIAIPHEHERAALWTKHLGVAVQGIERYCVTPGTIARSAAIVADPPSAATVHEAIRTVLEDKLAAVGTLLKPTARFDDLVLPEETREALEEIVARVRHRGTVLRDWGMADKLGGPRGVSALFSGEPGTGKTMAARIVAAELGLDLYQIDVSRIVSKWIGETEKNLAQVFDAAEAGHALLLFDEADSLFAKRTEVKSSVDRYANMEVNFLLTRIERFDGIAILTTNLDASIDPAFRRRLTFRVEFPLPTEEERGQLWRKLIPDGVDVRDLARTFEMSGAYIRNSVERAAYLAAADGERRVTYRYIRLAAELEYMEMGKVTARMGARQ